MGSTVSSHVYSNPYLGENLTLDRKRGRLRKKVQKQKSPLFDNEKSLYECLRKLPPHANVMRVFSVKEDEDSFSIEIERLDGLELFSLLTSAERYNMCAAAKACIIRQILLGLEHLHTHGIVHRDLKPENIMFRKNYRQLDQVPYPEIAIIDLDSALLLSIAHMGERRIIGTPAYMAPEYLQKGRPTVGADLWAAGIVMYTLVTGAPPFPVQKMSTGHEARIILQDATAQGINFDMECFHNDPAAKELCAGLLDFDPATRIASATEALKLPYCKSMQTSSLAKLIHPFSSSAETIASTRAESSERDSSF